MFAVGHSTNPWTPVGKPEVVSVTGTPSVTSSGGIDTVGVSADAGCGAEPSAATATATATTVRPSDMRIADPPSWTTDPPRRP